MQLKQFSLAARLARDHRLGEDLRIHAIMMLCGHLREQHEFEAAQLLEQEHGLPETAQADYLLKLAAIAELPTAEAEKFVLGPIGAQ
ncbi:hypothetical protein HY633_01375 [Candidatus Uhrbacteria bacterium]|nr:hypothetical protein [Candidatus Uhrbacteria bacterium]